MVQNTFGPMHKSLHTTCPKITHGVLILAPRGSSSHTKDWTVTLENGPSPSAIRGTVATVAGELAHLVVCTRVSTLHPIITPGVLLLAPKGSSGHTKGRTVTMENGPSPSAPRGTVAMGGCGLASAFKPRLGLWQGLPTQGGALIFILARGGEPLPPGPPPSIPWTRPPPPPSATTHLRSRVLGTFFGLGQFFSSRAFGAPIAGVVTPLCPFCPLLQTPCPNVP